MSELSTQRDFVVANYSGALRVILTDACEGTRALSVYDIHRETSSARINLDEAVSPPSSR